MTKWMTVVGLLALGVATTSEASATGMRPTRYLRNNGVRLAVYESGGREGPGILLVHGNTSAASSFGAFMATPFARRHRVVAVDLPGYGNSDNAASYNVQTFTDQIAYVANATRTADGVIVGWSLGGDLALQTAPRLPRARGYFLFGTAPLGYTPGLPAPFLTPAESYAGAAVNYGFVGALTPAQIDDYVTAFFRPGYRWIPRSFYEAGQRTDPATRTAVGIAGAGLDPTFQDEVAIARNLTVPIELVAGTKDAFVNPDYLDALAPSLPTLHDGDITYVRGAGHAIQWEDPLRFTALLADFVGDSRCD